MDSIVQAILNFSKLEVSLIKITNATPTSFVMSIESRVTHTGPIGATQSPMTVDLVGPKGIFGKLNLPEVKTTSKGATVIITDQKIDILDMDAYMAFVKSIQLDEKLTMRLENGKGTIKALGLTSKITYKKNVELMGMNGPKSTLVKTEVAEGGSFKNVMRIYNPSPVEIDMGAPTFAFKNSDGEILARQSGPLFIKRGDHDYETTGEVVGKGSVDNIQYIGESVEKESWIVDTVKYYDVPVTLTSELANLVKG